MTAAAEQQAAPTSPSREWKGPWRRYDIVKEGVIAIVVVSILTVLLAGLFSSPDEPQLTFQGWAAARRTISTPPPSRSWPVPASPPSYGPPYNTAGEGSPSDRLPRRSGSASRIRSTRPTTS